MPIEQDIINAHNHSAGHRDEIMSSFSCGCFYCISIFSPNEIEDWIDENPENSPGIKLKGYTALCPKCGIDSIIGSSSGYPITIEFLQKMKEYWF